MSMGYWYEKMELEMLVGINEAKGFDSKIFV
jgi:hypothetical protein